MNAQICGTHSEMAQGDLNMQDACEHVTDHHKEPSVAGCRYALVEDAVAKPPPEEHLSSNFEPSVPPSRTLSRSEAE